jgi:hypothetical protein
VLGRVHPFQSTCVQHRPTPPVCCCQW